MAIVLMMLRQDEPGIWSANRAIGWNGVTVGVGGIRRVTPRT
jgi:hypothetical protein